MHLAAYMTKNKLSDEDVAEATGRSRATINRIRRRLSRPDWSTMRVFRDWSNGRIKPDDFLDLYD
jgi:transcriptional regulator with XRE-family HTH domain